MVTNVNRNVVDEAREICELISKTLCNFSPNEQERALGILEGMAIMRNLQSEKQNGGNRNGS